MDATSSERPRCIDNAYSNTAILGTVKEFVPIQQSPSSHEHFLAHEFKRVADHQRKCIKTEQWMIDAMQKIQVNGYVRAGEGRKR